MNPRLPEFDVVEDEISGEAKYEIYLRPFALDSAASPPSPSSYEYECF
jgi:hypothetical protein